MHLNLRPTIEPSGFYLPSRKATRPAIAGLVWMCQGNSYLISKSPRDLPSARAAITHCSDLNDYRTNQAVVRI